ncbi:MAG: prenyltransferase/squalene oxidase repeat-containing protein [Planctomycetaceae bacterium]
MAEAIRKRYGKDKTFSVPILTALALTGRLGSPETAWKIVPQLPFELAACPHSWWAALQLPVVSYALPALIAIGQVRHHHRPSRNPLLRALRSAVSNRTLRLLGDIQPTSGGYLEATPLTSFVVLSLVGAGLTQNEVISKGVEFLVESAREDGSWAIDSDLATWVTTLSVRALSEVNSPTRIFSDEEIGRLREWLIGQQYQTIHPYTHAAPGGWAWTNLPGGVPDADDTPGALLALRSLDDGSPRVRMTVESGIGWLLDLQNRDGGIPTFCRGWGALPFDQSSADLTAHCLRAWRAWEEQVSPDLRQLIEMARTKAIRFLMSQQHQDGSWTPLWFGNQHAADDVNPTYGTSRVLMALAGEVADASALLNDSLMRAAEWMLSAQNSDGGWGGASECPSSIEETALATEALAAILRSDGVEASEALHGNEMASRIEQAISGGVSFLVQATQNGREFPPTPIGFYFAKLWYYETLYPLIDTVGALGSAISLRHERHAPTRFPHQPSTSPR